MGIYINGIEMPKSYKDIRIYADGRVVSRSLHMYGEKIAIATPATAAWPVVRGEWIVSRTDYGWNSAEFPTHCKCTVCGREVPYQDKDNYCPSCGAYMRETNDGI